jgi:hypothetical protein
VAGEVLVKRANGAADWAERLNKQYDEWRFSTVTGVINLGNDLIAAKADVGHGRFGQWVEKHLTFSWDTANAFMQIARWAASISVNDRNLLPPDWNALNRRFTHFRRTGPDR